jgi:lipoyl(octanoyl) transferase
LYSPDRSAEPALDAWLLGQVDYDLCLELQEQLARQAAVAGGRTSLLLCEHPPVLTIGRRGSHGHVHCEPRELAARQIEPRFVNHGGGCLIHLPGQLAVYPIVPLAERGWRVGDYLGRLQAALVRTMEDLRFVPQERPGRYGVWGRAGQVAAVGVAVRDGVAYHGAHVNVCPAMEAFRLVRTDPVEDTPVSSLFIEHPPAGKMSKVRESLVRRLVEALNCPRFHVSGGHPWLRRMVKERSPSKRVG